MTVMLTDELIETYRLEDPESQRLKPSSVIGAPLGSLRIAPDAGLSKVPFHHMQIWYAVIGGTLICLPGFALIWLADIGEIGFKVSMGVTILVLGLFWKFVLHQRFKNARTIDIYEGGLRFSDPLDAIGKHQTICWDQFDTHSNRVTVQPASQVVADDLLRVIYTVRLGDFSVAQKSHVLNLFVKRSQLELMQFVSAMIECESDPWAGYSA